MCRRSVGSGLPGEQQSAGQDADHRPGRADGPAMRTAAAPATPRASTARQLGGLVTQRGRWRRSRGPEWCPPGAAIPRRLGTAQPSAHGVGAQRRPAAICGAQRPGRRAAAPARPARRRPSTEAGPGPEQHLRETASPAPGPSRAHPESGPVRPGHRSGPGVAQAPAAARRITRQPTTGQFRVGLDGLHNDDHRLGNSTSAQHDPARARAAGANCVSACHDDPPPADHDPWSPGTPPNRPIPCSADP